MLLGCCSPIRRAYVASAVAFSLQGFLALAAFAAEHDAVPGQYVVTPRLAAAHLSGGSSADSLPNATVIKNLGSSLLVAPKNSHSMAYAVSADGTVKAREDDEFCISLIKSGQVSDCSPNWVMTASAVSNDPQLGSLWGLVGSNGIDAPGAWDLSTGGGNGVIAVIDTGADYNHPDLAANIWTNSGEIPGNGIDDDSNGYVDDVHGINAATHSGDPMDDNGHGTHVSGTIGAVGHNAQGVVGINWNTKIMALKFLDAGGSGSLSGAIAAIEYMIMMKNRGVNIRVVNNSWGGGGFSSSLFNAIQHARDAGILFVAAAGNEANDNDANPSYPASYNLDNVISVAAIDSDGNMASFSNYGTTQVDIAAPGVAITSTYPGNRYRSLSGTSMASPHVAGALGLLLASEPGLTNAQALARLYDSGVPMATLQGQVRTGRRLNVSRMLHNDTSAIPEPTPAPCSYSIDQIAYRLDRRAEKAPIVVQADEFNYYAFDLPFVFPFQGNDITRVHLSPNGVVYFNHAPDGMDFNNTSRAPLNSLAALHADLVASANPYGVRVSSDSSSATIYYLVRSFAHTQESGVEISITLSSDGTIEEHVNVRDAETLDALRDGSTIGINGPSNLSSKTFAYNDSKLASRFGLRFTPSCGGSGPAAPSVSAISMSGLGAQNEQTKVGFLGGKFLVNLTGSGSGAVTLKPMLNGLSCRSTSIVLQNGAASYVGRIPRKALRKIGLQADSARSSLAVRQAAKGSARKVSSRRLSASEQQSACRSLTRSLAIL